MKNDAIRTFEYLRVYEINNNLVIGASLEDAVALYKLKYPEEEIKTINTIRDSSSSSSSLALFSATKI